MPLLRGKPFTLKVTPDDLKPEDEVFFFELTEEVFTDYDEFFERVILCNSLLWTCECTGRNGLTYKEAIESEENVRNTLAAIPLATTRAVLNLVHQTRRSRIGDLVDEIMDYLKNRYQEGEIVETKIKDSWIKCVILKVYEKVMSVGSPTSKGTPGKKTPKKNDANNGAIDACSPIERNSSSWPDSSDLDYEIKLMKPEDSSCIKVNGKKMRRIKGSLTRDLVRLLLRQTCKRTTASTDDGYWIVEPTNVSKYDLGESFANAGPLPAETPAKFKEKRKRSSSQHEGQSPLKKRKSIENSKKSPKADAKMAKKKTNDVKRRRSSNEKKKGVAKEETKTQGKKLKTQEQRKPLTPNQKKKLQEKMKLKELAEKEKLKKKRLLQKEKEKEKLKKEKEEEKQKKKFEREREKERTTDIRKLEAEFLKQWARPRDDLTLEDLQNLPETTKFNTKISGDMFGDVLMIVEFLNIFGTLYDLKDSFTHKITYEVVEKALLEHDAEGVFYDIVKFLLQTFLKVSKEENEEEIADGESTDGTVTPEEQEDTEQLQEEEVMSGTVSLNATAAAAWPMLHQGMALDELTIDPFTLSEILRLHVLSSGVKIGGARSMWQRKGGFQFSDDPCVDFRHKEKSILTSMHTSCLYDLTTQEKLKVLCVLCNQILTLTTTRDFIEDSFEKVKELKKKLRELQNKEHKRRKLESAERWRRKIEESVKRKEEIEKRKKEKEAREGEAKKTTQQDELNASDPKNGGKLEKKKKGRPRKSKEPDAQQSQTNQPEELKEEKQIENLPEADPTTKKEEDTQEDKEKEHRLREEFKKEERELLDEIAKHASFCAEIPLGIDRIYNRYWSLRFVNGLLVEHDEEGRRLAGRDDNEDDDLEAEPDDVKGENEGVKEIVRETGKTEYARVTLDDIIGLRNSGKPLNKTLFMKYKCNLDNDKEGLISDSKILSSIVDSVQNGIDPSQYVDVKMPQWSGYSIEDDVDILKGKLNNRGLREVKLRNKIEKMSERLNHAVESCVLFDSSVPEIKPSKARQVKEDIVDKTLFKTMDDYLEANLRDQLLDFEERLWAGSLCILKVDNREVWREGVARRINELLGGQIDKHSSVDSVDDVNKGYVNEKDSTDHENNEKEIGNEVLANNMENSDCKMEVDDEPDSRESNHKEMTDNSANVTTSHDTSNSSLKSFPLKFLEGTYSKDENSRSATPVNVCTPMVNPRVKELATVLMQIKHGIEKKYLKPPLGEDEATKKERLREQLENAQLGLNGTSDKSRNESSSNKDKRAIKKEKLNGQEELKEENKNDDNPCLERWETSLTAATNFSQVFIHLNTLDRSVMWDKSVLNARCRICRKKGDAEMMLLCDGCDRGFHMYCLKPPVKKIPDGDWFCVDCRPKETRRGQRARKRPTKLEEFVDDVEDEMTNENANSIADEDSDAVDEDSGNEYQPVQPTYDGHNDFCAVCSNYGDLLCCDLCSRAFHVSCIYPPIRKIPKGDWSCQVCTGADLDLPKARRVATLERNREKHETMVAKELSRKQMKSSKRKQTEVVKVPNRKTRKHYSSPGPRANKQQKTLSEQPEETKRPTSAKSTRKSVGDPTVFSSRRHSGAFARYERRLCGKILEELINADDAEAFLLPVDVKVVSDYLDFIDHPMDLGTVKRNLNNAAYDSLDQFLDDIRLIFRNCETYNPPRSDVARAGSRLSFYFEQRLHELELIT